MSNDPGFTPAPDCIRDEIDATAALVFGAVWRWCQMERGRCEVAIEAIAERAGCKVTAARIRLRTLERHGWITAELREGRTTLYRDAGRWQLRAFGVDTAPETPSRNVGVPQRQTVGSGQTPTANVGGATVNVGVPQREALGGQRQTEGSLKRQKKRELKKQEEDTQTPEALAADAAAPRGESETFTAQVAPALVQATGFRGTVAGGKPAAWLGQCLGILGEATADDPSAALALIERIRSGGRWQYRKRSTAQFPDWLRSMVADLKPAATSEADRNAKYAGWLR